VDKMANFGSMTDHRMNVISLGEILNSQNFPKTLPKVLAKLLAIFCLRLSYFPAPPKN